MDEEKNRRVLSREETCLEQEGGYINVILYFCAPSSFLVGNTKLHLHMCYKYC
jgi:hypothetical protein